MELGPIHPRGKHFQSWLALEKESDGSRICVLNHSRPCWSLVACWIHQHPKTIAFARVFEMCLGKEFVVWKAHGDGEASEKTQYQVMASRESEIY
jgi:hypothetical protein